VARDRGSRRDADAAEGDADRDAHADAHAPPMPTAPVVPSLGLPPATRCVSRGTLKLKLKAPRPLKIVRATVAVNGKVKVRVKGAKARKPIKLRKISTIKVTIRASNRQTYTITRTYAACRKR
jgi:hypothetical protein